MQGASADLLQLFTFFQGVYAEQLLEPCAQSGLAFLHKLRVFATHKLLFRQVQAALEIGIKPLELQKATTAS